MDQYIGLDVSLKDTAVSIRENRKRIWRGKCPSDPKALSQIIRKHAPHAKLPDQGINLTARSTGTRTSDTAVSKAALSKGVVVMPLSRMNVVSSDTLRLMFGFSGLSEQEADRGTKLLAGVFQRGGFERLL